MVEKPKTEAIPSPSVTKNSFRLISFCINCSSGFVLLFIFVNDYSACGWIVKKINFWQIAQHSRSLLHFKIQPNIE